jgi:hypothetical protein
MANSRKVRSFIHELPPSLRRVEGEGDSARFAQADEQAKKEAHLFYKSSRLSLTYEMPFLAVRRVLHKVRFKPEELDTYQPWIELNPYQAAVRGTVLLNAPRPSIEVLEANDDPLVHVFDSLERVRVSEYRQYHLDLNLMERSRHVFQLLCASIHGERPE